MQFVGKYKRTKSLLIGKEPDNKNITFTITHRKTVTNKPSEFILFSIDGAPKKYFSSLYDTGKPGVSHCEHGGVKYRLSLSDSECKLELR